MALIFLHVRDFTPTSRPSSLTAAALRPCEAVALDSAAPDAVRAFAGGGFWIAQRVWDADASVRRAAIGRIGGPLAGFVAFDFYLPEEIDACARQ